MIIKFASIFFLILCLSSCDSSVAGNKNVVSKESIFAHYTTKYSEILKDEEGQDFLKNCSKIRNQKDAIDFLGEPSEKIIAALTWSLKPNPDPDPEYIEIWWWKKPMYISILFNKEGKVHDKIQLTILPKSFYKND